MRIKQVLIVLSIVIFCSVVSYRLGVLAQITGTLKSIVEPGSMVTEASYIIFTDGNGNYYARNGMTGEIEFSGTVPRTVIQSAIDSLTNGGKILFKAGTYPINGIITIGKVTLQPPDTAYQVGISFKSESYCVAHLDFGANSGFNITYNSEDGQLEGVTFEDFEFDGQSGTADWAIRSDMGNNTRLRSFVFHHNRALNFGYYTLDMTNLEQSYITDNVMGGRTNTKALIRIKDNEYEVGNLYIKDNDFVGTGTSGAQVLFETRISRNKEGIGLTKLRGNHHLGNNGGLDWAIKCIALEQTPDRNFSVTNIEITGSHFENINGINCTGYSVGGNASSIKYLNIHDNTQSVQSNGMYFILFDSYTKNSDVHSNRIYGSSLSYTFASDSQSSTSEYNRYYDNIIGVTTPINLAGRYTLWQRNMGALLGAKTSNQFTISRISFNGTGGATAGTNYTVYNSGIFLTCSDTTDTITVTILDSYSNFVANVTTPVNALYVPYLWKVRFNSYVPDTINIAWAWS